MKSIFTSVFLTAFLLSCQSVKEVYDDVYDAAEKPDLIENADGYADYIKDSKGEYKTVTTTTPVFGGYYNNNDQASGLANNQDCDCCDRIHFRNFNHYRFMYSNGYPAYFGQYNYFYPTSYGCNCCDEYSYYGSLYSAYGFYNSMGYWQSYYPWGYSPWGYDPYGYYSYAYGWNNYGWNNNTNNNWWNNNNNNNNNNGSGTTNTSSANHHYGHRGTVYSGSSNTSVYEHTVKVSPIQFEQTTATNTTVFNSVYIESFQNQTITGGTITDSKPLYVNLNDNAVLTDHHSSGINSGHVQTNSLNNVQTTINNDAAVNTVSHVPATSPFVSKYNTGYSAVKNGGTVTNTYSGYDPQRSNDSYAEPMLYQTTNSTENNSGNSTSRSSGNERGTTYNNSYGNTNSSSGGGYEGHRSSGSSGNSGGGTTSGSSRTTSTSRR
ncbi:MAG: hypothetical protein JNJ99_11715 [Crocinitomicaceae bacterium]|nr:hypothetical protein [Crocinitomicaceae bacterium]